MPLISLKKETNRFKSKDENKRKSKDSTDSCKSYGILASTVKIKQINDDNLSSNPKSENCSLVESITSKLNDLSLNNGRKQYKRKPWSITDWLNIQIKKDNEKLSAANSVSDITNKTATSSTITTSIISNSSNNNNNKEAVNSANNNNNTHELAPNEINNITNDDSNEVIDKQIVNEKTEHEIEQPKKDDKFKLLKRKFYNSKKLFDHSQSSVDSNTEVIKKTHNSLMLKFKEVIEKSNESDKDRTQKSPPKNIAIKKSTCSSFTPLTDSSTPLSISTNEQSSSNDDENCNDDGYGTCFCSDLSKSSVLNNSKFKNDKIVDNDGLIYINSELVDYIKMKQNEWKNYSNELIDTHCHFDMLFYKIDYKKSIDNYFIDFKSLFIENFQSCINVICDPRQYSTKSGLDTNMGYLSHKSVYGTIGCHPHFANYWSSRVENIIYSKMTHPKIVAIGECGIDISHKNKVEIEQQHKVFRAQLSIARETGMPIVIHCRDAENDVFDILSEALDSNHRIHLHCFTGGWNIGKKFLDKFPNLCIGVTPLLTFPSADTTHDLIKNISIDRLLCETDAPYFVPRGRFPNKTISQSHPAFVFTVIERVSQIKGITIPELITSNRKNVKKIYGF